MPKMSLIMPSKLHTAAAALMVAITASGCVAASREATTTCERSIPNESAGVNFVAGMPYYVSPRNVAKLTGCQTMWNSKGHVTAQIVFREGSVVQYIEYADAGIVQLSCAYAKGVAHLQNCPDLQDLVTGFRVLDADTEKSLPTFDDLRRQGGNPGQTKINSASHPPQNQ